MALERKLGQYLPGIAKWAGGGAGAAAVFLAFELLKSQPALAERILEWGPQFALMVVLVVIGNHRAGQVVEMLRLNASAIQETAVAQSGFRIEMGTIATSLKQVADSHGTELEAIKASLGSAHGKLDRVAEILRERIPG